MKYLRKDKPIVTVVTIVLNGEKELPGTIDSILSQNYENLEYIIIDGGSKDGTLQVIEKYSPYIDLWISERDKGIYDAMNKGILKANGDWIIFMNAGDRFFDSNVINSIDFAKFEKYYILYGDSEIRYQKNTSVQVQKNRHKDYTKSIIHQSMFVKRSFLLNNPYDLSFKIMADYDNLLKVSKSHIQKIYYIPLVVSSYSKDGVSSRPLYTYFKEYIHIAQKHLSVKEFFCFLIYIYPRYVYSLRKKIVK